MRHVKVPLPPRSPLRIKPSWMGKAVLLPRDVKGKNGHLGFFFSPQGWDFLLLCFQKWQFLEGFAQEYGREIFHFIQEVIWF